MEARRPCGEDWRPARQGIASRWCAGKGVRLQGLDDRHEGVQAGVPYLGASGELSAIRQGRKEGSEYPVRTARVPKDSRAVVR